MDIQAPDMETAKAMVRMLAEGFIIDKPPNPWATLGVWASIALGIPLVVLVLGSSLVWAFSGFATKTHSLKESTRSLQPSLVLA